jgi:integrase
MHDICYSMGQVIAQGPKRSGGTNSAYGKTMRQVASLLAESGFPTLLAKNIKKKHLFTVMEYWMDQRLALGTLKNRMSHLRRFCKAIGKPGLLARDNATYGICRRSYISKEKAKKIADNASDVAFSTLKGTWLYFVLLLQKHFGMRREEALKFRVHSAVKGNRIHLQKGWCKGGRKRNIPILTRAQRWLLELLKINKTKGESMIPAELSFKQGIILYQNECRKYGIKRPHGFRYCYAQRRYLEQTGLDCPCQGGPSRKDQTPEQQLLTDATKLMVAEELGHGRAQITATYYGR